VVIDRRTQGRKAVPLVTKQIHQEVALRLSLTVRSQERKRGRLLNKNARENGLNQDVVLGGGAEVRDHKGFKCPGGVKKT